MSFYLKIFNLLTEELLLATFCWLCNTQQYSSRVPRCLWSTGRHVPSIVWPVGLKTRRSRLTGPTLMTYTSPVSRCSSLHKATSRSASKWSAEEFILLVILNINIYFFICTFYFYSIFYYHRFTDFKYLLNIHYSFCTIVILI